MEYDHSIYVDKDSLLGYSRGKTVLANKMSSTSRVATCGVQAAEQMPPALVLTTGKP